LQSEPAKSNLQVLVLVPGSNRITAYLLKFSITLIPLCCYALIKQTSALRSRTWYRTEPQDCPSSRHFPFIWHQNLDFENPQPNYLAGTQMGIPDKIFEKLRQRFACRSQIAIR